MNSSISYLFLIRHFDSSSVMPRLEIKVPDMRVKLTMYIFFAIENG